jgi:hypothetical protein
LNHALVDTHRSIRRWWWPHRVRGVDQKEFVMVTWLLEFDGDQLRLIDADNTVAATFTCSDSLSDLLSHFQDGELIRYMDLT